MFNFRVIIWLLHAYANSDVSPSAIQVKMLVHTKPLCRQAAKFSTGAAGSGAAVVMALQIGSSKGGAVVNLPLQHQTVQVII